MSFSLTTAQMLARTKTVTRRTAWGKLAPGTLLQAVEKSRGLKRGERVRRLGVIRVLFVRVEPLVNLLDQTSVMARRAAQADVVAEGFPDLSPEQFVAMFCAHNKCKPGDLVTRIEFEHVTDGG